MHGGRDNVVGRFIAKLDNKLAEISFPDFDAGFFQRRTQVNFLGHHGLGLDYRAHALAGREVLDIVAGLFSVGGPKDMPTMSDDSFFELQKISIQVIDGLPLYLLASTASGLPILETRAASKHCGIVAFQAVKNNFAVHQVRRLDRRVLQETLCGRRAHVFSCAKMLARWMVRAGALRLPRIP